MTLLAAWPILRRFVASFVLVALAVVAVANSAHAGLHAFGASHGVAPHVVQSDGPAGSDVASSAEGETSAAHDVSDCSCACHAVASGLAPSGAPHLIPPRLAATLRPLADLSPPSTRPDGPMRPPRHP